MRADVDVTAGTHKHVDALAVTSFITRSTMRLVGWSPPRP